MDTPVSKYHIITKISSIKQQRPDRISHIMTLLENNGLIKSISTSSATFYQITQKGSETYLKWVKDFLDFARLIHGSTQE
jgi:DNA-binding PadR family transcriptional regulator